MTSLFSPVKTDRSAKIRVSLSEAGGAAVSSDERQFAFLVFRDLPANPTDDDVGRTIDAADPTDGERIRSLIFDSESPAATYSEFQEWAEGVGDIDVRESGYAGDSFAFGVEELFKHAPVVRMTSFAVADDGDGGKVMDVAVTVMDGEESKRVSSEQGGGMVATTADVVDWTAESRLEPHVTDLTQGVAAPVEFSVKPGDGTSEKAFLRIQK